MAGQKDEAEPRRGRTGGSEPPSRDYREIFITGPWKIIQLCLHPSSRLQREDETKPMKQQQESRQQKYASDHIPTWAGCWKSTFFQIIQPDQTGEMRIHANTGAIGWNRQSEGVWKSVAPRLADITARIMAKIELITRQRSLPEMCVRLTLC